MAQGYQINLSPTARLDLLSIVEYLQIHASTEVADKVNFGILTAIGTLDTFPHRNPIIEGVNEKRIHRSIIKWSYRIAYTVIERNLTVLIVGISHTSQNPQQLIDRLSV